MKAYHGSAILRNDGLDANTGKVDLNAGVGVQVTIRINSTQALASIFDLNEVAIANPLTTNNNGNYSFKAADSIYDIIISEGTANEEKIQKVEVIEAVTPKRIIPFYTLALAIAETDPQLMFDGAVIDLRERTTGLGGGAIYDVVLASGVTTNTYDIVQCMGIANLAIVLRVKSEIYINQLGVQVGADISSVVQHAINIAKPNNIINFEGLENDFYRIENTVLINKAIVLKGTGNGKSLNQQNPTYPDTTGIIIADGVVAFLAGSRVGITTGAETTFAYDSGKIVLDGLTMRPENPSSSIGTVGFQCNLGHNFEVKNCLFRYMHASIDCTGAYGIDIHNNMFISCDDGVIADPDYVNGYGNPAGTDAGYETNDIRVYNNTFSGRGVSTGKSRHIYVHSFGHSISWWGNSFEQANKGVEISGYTGINPAAVSRTWYGVEESGTNYYENLSRPVIIGSASSNNVYVFDVVLGGGNLNVSFHAPDTFYRPYVTVNLVWNFKFRSGSYFGIPAGFLDYNEIHFQDSNTFPTAGILDVELLWCYSGYTGVNAVKKNSEKIISNKTLELNPFQVYIDPTDPAAVGRFDVTGNGNLKYTSCLAGSAGIPFKDLTTLSDWLNKTPNGAFTRKNASELKINIANNTDGSLTGLREIPAIQIVGVGDLYGGFFLTDCSDVVFDGLSFANSGTAKFGQSRLINTNAVAKGCTYKVDGDAVLGTGSAWFQNTNSKLVFEGGNTASGAGRVANIVRLSQGSVAFTEPTLSSAASGSIATIDSGEAALIVS